MKVLSCAAARRRLQAYHDDELSVGQQIEVDAHLETCAACTAALEELDDLRSVLRAATPGRVALTAEEHETFHESVLGRVGAEQRMSVSVRLRSMFEDMHFVYAGLGAVGATVSCIAIMLSMMNFAALTNPGFNQNPVVIDARILMYAWPEAPNPMPGVLGQAGSADDGAFTLSGVMTREGRLTNLELHPEDGQTPKAGSSQALAAEAMLGAVSQARFEPARVGGLPIAVNMVWLVTHTTVRGTEAPKVVPAAPIAKKRRVDWMLAPSIRKNVVA
jgi:predicted anti-sigma-YlaC factor YlaD